MKKFVKAPVKLYLISPREPCGATWLINCFLALGIKTYRETVDQTMWLSNGDRWKLNPDEKLLKKWLPTLSEQDQFQFRDDFEVEWAHKWPTGETRDCKVIYFVRDPRDALFSRYKREAPQASYQEFLDFPDPANLLDKLDSWNLFNEVWLSQPNVKFFRFEEYKQDARATLQDVLSYAGIATDSVEIDDTITRSSFEAAAAAEVRYRETHPEDNQIINRASQVGAWKNSDVTSIALDISIRCGAMMSRMGYDLDNVTDSQPCSFLPHSKALQFYRKLDVPTDFWSRSEDGREATRLTDIVDFSRNLEVAILDKYQLLSYESWQLLTTMKRFLKYHDLGSCDRLAALMNKSSDGPVVFWRMNNYLRSRGFKLPTSIRLFALRFFDFLKLIRIRRSR